MGGNGYVRCVVLLLLIIGTDSTSDGQHERGKSGFWQLSPDAHAKNDGAQKNNIDTPSVIVHGQNAVGQQGSNHGSGAPKPADSNSPTGRQLQQVRQSNSGNNNAGADSKILKDMTERGVVDSVNNVENKVRSHDNMKALVSSSSIHAIEPANNVVAQHMQQQQQQQQAQQQQQQQQQVQQKQQQQIHQAQQQQQQQQHQIQQQQQQIQQQQQQQQHQLQQQLQQQLQAQQQQQQQQQIQQQQIQQQQQQQQLIQQHQFQPLNNNINVRGPFNSRNTQEAQPKKQDMRIMWDWSDFLINYEQYVMPEQKVRRAPHATTGEPWPMPQYYTAKKNKVYKLNRDKFHFRIVKESCDIIEKAVLRYKDYIINDTILDMYDNLQHAQGSSFEDLSGKYESDLYRRATYLDVVTVKIRRPCAKMPSDKMDESYDLFVKRKESYIWSNEVWGAIRGLETFSQLVFRGVDNELYIKDTTINDYPRFQHRGIHIDTSRHFLFKDVIYDVMEAMAMNKMNVLHWHIVDDQSFPYQSKVYPELSLKGAYHPSFVYTHEDIADIIEYARLRGIRVMPEFDTPGHTYSWGLSRPDLLTQCYQGAHPVNGYLGPLDPSKNETYRFLKNFFNEVLHVFKDQYIHLGGDEVPMTCWSSNPEVIKLLHTLQGNPNRIFTLQNIDPFLYSYEIKKVLEYYERRLVADLKELGQRRSNGVRFVMWQEIMNNEVKLPNDTIIQVWMGDMTDVYRAIENGYNVIYSTCWYLNLIEYGVKWPKYYNCDPVDTSMGYNIDEKKVLGGEAAIWAEYVDNENLMSTLWPGASAPAERLWSNKDVRDVEAAGKRLSEHRCRMLSRGLSVGMINGPDYCLRRGRRHDRDGYRNCTGDRCYRGFIFEDIEKFNVHVQQRGGKPSCNQMIPTGSSLIYTLLSILLVIMFLVTSLKLTGAKMVQVRFCKNRTILLVFSCLLIVYLVYYATLWVQVMDYKGSYEKRIKSYPSPQYKP